MPTWNAVPLTVHPFTGGSIAMHYMTSKTIQVYFNTVYNVSVIFVTNIV